MKIAISGAANSGKSTFTAALSDRFGLPPIEEGFGGIRELLKTRPNVDAFKSLFFDIYEAKHEQETRYADGFIADRCVIDIFCAWCSFAVLRQQPETQDLYRKCRDRSQHYDCIVFLPWGAFNYEGVENYVPGEKNADMNRWLNMRQHATMIGLAHSWVPSERIIMIPDEAADVDARAGWLEARLAAR